MHVLLAQAETLGDQLIQGLETASAIDSLKLILIAVCVISLAVVIVAMTRWRRERSDSQISDTLIKLIDDLREERKTSEKQADEKDQRHQEVIQKITDNHRNEMQELTSALTMQVDVLTGVSTSSQIVEHGIEAITRQVEGINPATRAIADLAHESTRQIIIAGLTSVIMETAAGITTEVQNLHKSIQVTNENANTIYSDGGVLMKIAGQLQTILLLLKAQDKTIHEKALSDLIAGTADSAGSNGNGRFPDHSAGSDGGKPVSDSGSDPAGTAGDTRSNPGGQPGTE